MKAKKYILGFLGMALMFTACDPSVEETPAIGNPPTLDDIHFTVAVNTDDPNTMDFGFSSELISPYWGLLKKDGSILSTNKRSFSLKYMWAGEFKSTIQGYGRGGLSQAKEFVVSIPQNDPLINFLTGGDTPKVWVMNASVSGHLGCGQPDLNTPNWYSAAPNSLAGKGIYDDEMIFKLNDNLDYILETHGDIYVNESAAGTMDPVTYPNGSDEAVTVPYTQPAGQKWYMDRDADGILYLKFTDKGFPCYVANPDALGARYEVTLLTENELELQWKGDGINWYMKYKVKK